MERKVNRFIKLYPWCHSMLADLLFYIAVDTLFLTVVKSFSAAQIVSITSLAQFICIAFQFPILFIIRRVGNNCAMRVRGFFMLLSALFITFGGNFYLVLLGRVFRDIGIIFGSAAVVALENNLDLVDKRRDFVRIRTAGNTIYSIITMLISFVASFMFNLNHYLPMFGCIAACAVGFILSFFMEDCSGYNRITYKTPKGEKVKIHYGKFIVTAIVTYAVFYVAINTGQAEGKLFIQQQILADFSVEDTAIILGAVICVSRIIRVFSNILFAKLYEKYQAKMGVVLPALLWSAMGLLLFGSLIPWIWVKIVVMSLGYIVILFARDPFRLFMQDVIFENTPKEQHQTLLAMLEFGVRVGSAGMGLSFAAILTAYPMAYVIAVLFTVTFVEIFLSLKIYKMITAAKQAKMAQ